jgi:phenylacetate-CoA ligase
LAVTWRGYRWAGADLGRRSVYIWSWPYAGKSGWPLLKEIAYQRFFGRTFFSVFDLSERTFPRIAAGLRKIRPEFIVCYVSGGVAVGEWLLAHGEAVPAPRGIITGAEPLHESQRAVLEKAFGAPVFNTYGGREFMLMGAECPAHEGLHVSADHLLIETVDAAGKPVVGQRGRVLVTDLHNYGMPFIRYANGDLATLETRACSCGRGLPLFRSIDGREAELVSLPDGRRIPSLYFVHVLKDFAQIRYFQVVQRALDEFVLQIVPARPGAPMTFEYEDKLRADLGAVRVRTEIVTDIPLSKSGKRRVFVSGMAQPAGAP